MKSRLDILLVVGLALCTAAGQFVAADRLSLVAGALLAVCIVRMLGASITWVLTGR